MPEPPKPRLFHVAVSVLVILVSLFLISAAIATFMADLDPCSVFGGAILILLPAVLAIQQYRATFRHIRSAAKMAAGMLFFVGIVSAFVAFMIIIEVVRQGDALPWGILITQMILFSVAANTARCLNLWWGRGLPYEAESYSSPRFTIRELLAATAAVCFVAAVSSYIVRSIPPTYGEHVDLADAPFDLPENATNISFCHGFRGTVAYEFTTDVASFRDWVDAGIGSIESEASDVKLVPITSPVSITRYIACSTDLTGPDSITVANGLHYSWSFEDRGVYAVFDSTTNRAYYFAHFH